MASSTSSSAAVTCAENIALLHLLHTVPSEPSRNPIELHRTRQEGYTLSFLRERRLTGTLAFLSNLKDGPEHIPAVCVQESPKSRSLRVLIAVNKARPGDGKKVLQEIKLGFESIFELLSGVSDDGTPGVEDQVFAAIISMCSVRILCRLRLGPNNRKKTKQPIKKLLQEAINSLRWVEKEKPQEDEMPQRSRSFIARAREVIKLLDAWSKHRTQPRQLKLVEGIHRLWRVGGLQALFNTIPDRIMGPSWRENLLNTISKVARYREAAQFLYRTAKKIPLTRRMKVVLVDLPQSVFQTVPAKQPVSTLSSTISRINAHHSQKWDIDKIYRLLDNDKKTAPEIRFTKRSQKTLKDAKIHAEIQLLFYCELQAFKLPPRVVCSTKDACFLCNAFIQMYGKMHTPRCHGVLYPGWRLPFSPRLKVLEQRFNGELENFVRGSIDVMIDRQEKSGYPQPLESTLMTLPWSVSTLPELRPAEAAVGEEGEGVRLQERITVETEPPESTPSAGPAARTDNVSSQPSNAPPLQPSPSSRDPPPDTISAHDYTLTPGHILSKHIKIAHTSPLYSARHLEVQFEYSPKPSQPTPPPKNLPFSIEWLAVGEAKKALAGNALEIVNAETLEEGTEVEHRLHELGYLYLAARGEIVKIFVGRREAGLSSGE